MPRVQITFFWYFMRLTCIFIISFIQKYEYLHYEGKQYNKTEKENHSLKILMKSPEFTLLTQLYFKTFFFKMVRSTSNFCDVVI